MFEMLRGVGNCSTKKDPVLIDSKFLKQHGASHAQNSKSHGQAKCDMSPVSSLR